jgi:hypothetical protein
MSVLTKIREEPHAREEKKSLTQRRKAAKKDKKTEGKGGEGADPGPLPPLLSLLSSSWRLCAFA